MFFEQDGTWFSYSKNYAKLTAAFFFFFFFHGRLTLYILIFACLCLVLIALYQNPEPQNYEGSFMHGTLKEGGSLEILPLTVTLKWAFCACSCSSGEREFWAPLSCFHQRMMLSTSFCPDSACCIGIT